MTKKLNSTEKWKRYIESRQISELRKLQSRKTKRSKPIPHARFRPQQLQFITLEVPQSFSIIDNPAETIEFFRTFRLRSRGYNLSLDMSAVTHLTVDAITTLVAEIAAIGRMRIVRGTTPKDTLCKTFLYHSGFFDHVKSREPLPPGQKGRIVPRKSRLVEPVTAQELIKIGTKAAHGVQRRCYPVYSALIECMSNTHNHATGKTETMGTTRHWPTLSELCSLTV